MEGIEFTGKSLRSAEDLERLIKEAKFEVGYYEKDVKKAQDKVYLRQLALDSLIKEQSDLLESEYEYLNGDEKYV
tara:strand:+ start:76 stop:300 length:225 start_codon:yes stop_codon:yes gene_type:complete